MRSRVLSSMVRIVPRISENTICRYRGHRPVVKTQYDGRRRTVMDTDIRPHSSAENTSARFPLPQADLDSRGFRTSQIDRLIALIERHIAEGRYPGCQIALARHGKLGLNRSFGN